jgi:predicted transcriptional regulator
MKIEDLSTRKLARLLGITQRAVEDLAKRGVVQRGERS